MVRELQKTRRVVSIDTRQRDAMSLIRRLVETDTSRINFSAHALERMDERGIVARDVYRTLQIGEPYGGVERGKNEEEIKLTISFQPRGMREIAVVTVSVIEGERVLVKTVMWRDEK